MNIIKTSSELLQWRSSLIDSSVGFVPTMGALHGGHLSLVQKSVADCNLTIVSIFINPLQFSEDEDLDTYPVDIDGDIEKLKSAGVDVVFLPSKDDIYKGGDTFFIDENEISKRLEGKSRPHFFRGVLTVVGKLFNLVRPHQAYFGKKDAQQLILIQRMVENFNFPIKIVACDTVREHNGLAMSSRNEYLSREDRDGAKIIYLSLAEAQHAILNSSITADEARDMISDAIRKNKKLKIDYVSVASLSDLTEYHGAIKDDLLISVAVFIADVRLIDSVFIVD